MRIINCGLLLLLVSLLSINTFAGGYKVAMQGQKQLGMGHAATGLYLDAASLFFNPGALVLHGDGFNLQAGLNFLQANSIYQNSKTRTHQTNEKQLSTPASFYGIYRLNEKWILGLGVNTPFGSSLDWQDNWEGRAMITSIAMQSYFIQPTVSYQLNEKWGLGLGLILASGKVNLQKDIPTTTGSVELNGTAKWAWGYNIGVFFQANSKWSFGLNYRSKVTADIEGGQASFTQPQAFNAAISPDDSFSASLPMISSINFGVGYRLNNKFLFALDLNYDQWSEYKELTISFDKNASLNNPQTRAYKNTLIFRLGAQYDISERVQLRGGYYFDPSPVNKSYFTVETPSLDSHGFTLGGSVNLGKGFGVDTSVLLLSGKEATVQNIQNNFSGEFKSRTIALGLGFSYQF